MPWILYCLMRIRKMNDINEEYLGSFSIRYPINKKYPEISMYNGCCDVWPLKLKNEYEIDLIIDGLKKLKKEFKLRNKKSD